MKHSLHGGLAVAVLACASTIASADMYFDPAGDVFNNDVFNLDITSVEVTNDATDLFVTINVDNLDGRDWGKYLLMFDTQAGGRTDNPWNRAIDTNGNELDAFVGSWIDNGGGSLFYNGDAGGWNQNGDAGLGVDFGTSSITYSISLAQLGVGVGDVIRFDVATTGGFDGDPGIDLLSTDVTQPGWGEGTSVMGDMRSFTVVPAPGALALLGLGGLVARRRRG